MGSNNLRHTLPEIMDELIGQYQLGDSATVRDALRKKLEKVCRGIIVQENPKLNLWQKSFTTRNGQKKPEHLFDENEKRLLLSSPDLKQYIILRSQDNVKVEYFEAEQKAEEINQKAGAFAEEDMKCLQEAAPCGGHRISDEELYRKKMELMVEALYLKFFEEIDVTELLADMETADMRGLTDNTAETFLANEHLLAGSKYYCKEKKQGKEKD